MHRALSVIGLPLLLGISLVVRAAVPATTTPPLRLATWNMEWLVDDTTAQAARIDCRAARSAVLPCDVVQRLSRDSADIARLAAYARRLDADIIAFQEVQNAAIAQRVFRGYRICLHAGPGVQHVGFALRPGLARDCGTPLAALAVGGQGRAGLQLTITPPGLGTIELLVIHLKSGCAHDPPGTASDACRLLAAQARVLGQWIAAQSAAQSQFIVLGDFNRGGPPDGADPFWQRLDPSLFEASSTALPFANCSWGAPYRAFIDHILISRSLAAERIQRTWSQLRFHPRDAAYYRLPDHCPVMVSLNVSAAL